VQLIAVPNNPRRIDARKKGRGRRLGSHPLRQLLPQRLAAELHHLPVPRLLPDFRRKIAPQYLQLRN
jgi:hypothetical protein